jgi:hypothetical protein
VEEPTRRLLFSRMARPLSYASALVLFSLLVGTAGYHWCAAQPWIDAFLNACMLLGGMGPVGDIVPFGGKLFAGVFALYAGLVFLVVTALVLSPVFHHVLHRFHWESKKQT